jgi:chemotaxis protein methyltransferase CheR
VVAPPGRDFARLKELVIQRTGHFYYQDKDDSLWDRVSRRMRDKGILDLEQYLLLLADPDAAEWSALEAEITIGETYFFRYTEQFTALARTILPSIIERNAETRRIRIWSAGCATGAEPYSVAILLWRLLGDDIDNWRISILGTDINDKFLEQARKGQFGQWALRAVSDEERDQLFTPVDHQSWQLQRRFRSKVRFERHNLMTLVEGQSPLEFADFDLIMCRNVLIYFDPATIPKLIEAFRDRLVEAGWLLLGHAEPNPAFAAILQAIALPGTAAYRNMPPEPEPFRAEPVHQPPMVVPALPPTPVVAPAKPRRLPLPPPVAAPQLRPDDRQLDEIIAEVQSLSDLGNLEAGLQACAEAIRHHPTEPRLYFYEGLIRRARAEDARSEDCLKKALFLDRNYIMAHYHLGLIQLHRGNQAGGRRHLANAARLSLALAGETDLVDGDGIKPDTLVDLVRFHLDHHAPGSDR